jgi:hypothetical protein
MCYYLEALGPLGTSTPLRNEHLYPQTKARKGVFFFGSFLGEDFVASLEKECLGVRF